jgi:hypothetical protein
MDAFFERKKALFARVYPNGDDYLVEQRKRPPYYLLMATGKWVKRSREKCALATH